MITHGRVVELLPIQPPSCLICPFALLSIYLWDHLLGRKAKRSLAYSKHSVHAVAWSGPLIPGLDVTRQPVRCLVRKQGLPSAIAAARVRHFFLVFVLSSGGFVTSVLGDERPSASLWMKPWRRSYYGLAIGRQCEVRVHWGSKVRAQPGTACTPPEAGESSTANSRNERAFYFNLPYISCLSKCSHS